MAEEPSDSYQPPPRRDPECALLALLVHQNDIFHELPFMHYEQLKNPGYREMYLAMQTQHAERRPFNITTLRAALAHQPALKGRIDEFLDNIEQSVQVHMDELERKKEEAARADKEFSPDQYFADLAKNYVASIRTGYQRDRLYEGTKAFLDSLDRVPLEEAALHLEQLTMSTLAALRDGKGSVSITTVLHDVFQNVQDIHDRKSRLLGLSTGFYELDDLTSGLQPGNLYVIAGRPSMGKTSLLCNILENITLREQKKALMFSLEMSKEQIATMMLCSHARVDSTLLRSGRVSEEEFQKLVLAAGALHEGRLHIFDEDPVSIEALVDEARRVKRREDIAIIGIDYLQRIRSPGMQKYVNRPMEVAHVSNSLKALAKSLKVPVVVNAQLNRSPEGREDRKPMLADLRESGAIEQDADVAMLLYREEYYARDTEKRGIAEVIIAKNRSGPIGIVELAFLQHYTRFENLAVARQVY